MHQKAITILDEYHGANDEYMSQMNNGNKDRIEEHIKTIREYYGLDISNFRMGSTISTDETSYEKNKGELRALFKQVYQAKLNQN